MNSEEKEYNINAKPCRRLFIDEDLEGLEREADLNKIIYVEKD